MEKILLIGENIPYLESIAEEFKKLGFSSFTAGEEEDGQKIIKNQVPDVILMPQGIKRFNALKLVFNLREVNLLSKLVYLHKEDVIPNPPDDSFYLFVPDSLSPDLIVTRVVEKIDEIHPLGEMSIRDVLWMLKFEGKSAILRVFTDEAEGEIIVVDGDPVSCKVGVDSGDKALETLVHLESIAYEISWDVPQDVERNIVSDYKHFLGEPVLESHEAEVKSGEVKNLEDLSLELDKDIKEFEVGEPLEEEFSFDDFPVFGEEEEKGEKEEFPWNFEGEELKTKAGEKPDEEGLTLYEDKDLMKETEEKTEEFDTEPPESVREETLEKEGEEIELPEELNLPESMGVKKETEEETEEKAPIDTGEEEVSQTVESAPEMKFEPQMEEESIEKEIKEESVDKEFQEKLLNGIKQVTGINSAILIKGGKVVAVVPEESIKEFTPFIKIDADEGYLISGGKIYAIVHRGDLAVITCWRSGKPGFAVYSTKKLLLYLQD